MSHPLAKLSLVVISAIALHGCNLSAEIQALSQTSAEPRHFIDVTHEVSTFKQSQIQSGYVKVSNDLTLYYEQAGHGTKTIVFIPGWTMSTEVYEHQLDYFKNSNEWRFITYDPRGQGRSTKTEGGHYYEQHGRDLKNFLDALDLHSVVIGGWSYGGLDMLSYVQQFGSDRLLGLIMIDSPPKSTSIDNLKEWVWYRYDDADGAQEYFTLGPVRNREKFNKEFAQWMLVTPTPERIRWVTDIANHTSDTVAGMLNAAGIFLNFTKELKSLEGRIPLLYTVRAEVKDVVESWAKQNTPSAKVASFGNHLLFWEFHEKYNKVLADYLLTVDAHTLKNQP